MAGSNPSLVVKIGANIEALKAALQLGQTELIKTAAGAQALAGSLNGAKLEQSALQMAVAIKAQFGGATSLTASEAKKADAAFTAWFEKAAKTGKVISPELAKIAADTKKVVDETKKAEEEARKFAEAQKKLAEESQNAGGAFAGLFGKLAGGVAIGTLVADALKSIGAAAMAAVGAVASSLPNMINKAIELGGSLFDMSLKTGASVENLSKLRYVSSQTGISMDTFTNSMFKMQVALGKTGSEAKQTREALTGLGLDMTTLKNSKPDDAFIAIMQALEKVPNRAEQARIGMALFSKGFKDMAGLTQESITELMQAAEDLGLVYTTEFAAAADIAGDAIARIKMQWEALTIRIGAAFLPAVIGIAETFSGAFKDAINEANAKLGEMGGGSGFLATVARAMGNGNEALAAQIQLYEYLRDAIIAVIRYGVEPLIAAFSVVMSWLYKQKMYYDEVRLGLLMLEQGYNRVAAAVVALQNIGSNAADYEKAMAPMRKAIADTSKEITEVGKAILMDAAASADWAKAATLDNAVIEAALTKVEGKHIDLAAMIKQNALLAKAAAGESGKAIEEENKKVEQLTASTKELTLTYETLKAQGASAQVIFEALGSSASGLRAKFAAVRQEVPADVQKVVDAIKELGMQIQIAKWMEQQRADVRKVLEAMAKDTEALATKQREALNKAYVGNLDVAIKAQEDLQKLEQDSLEKRLAVVSREMQGRREALDENASNYEASLNTINLLEQESARQATEAWLDHVADMKKAMGPSFLVIFRTALEGIPDIITAAFTGGGGIGGAISGILSDLGGALGEKLGGMLARSLDGVLGKLGAKIGGAIFDMIPGIGGAIGALMGPVIDKAWGWISKREGRQVNDLRDAYIAQAGGYDKLVEQARKAGVELSSSSAFQRASTVEAWNKAVADLDAKLRASAEARKKLLADVMAGERLATQALIDEMAAAARAGGEAAAEAASYFNAMLSRAATGLTAMFAGLQAGASAAAQAAAVKLHIAAGMTEADAKKAAEGITGIFVTTQAQATGLAAAVAGTFAAMIERGATLSEALAAIKGPLDTMRRQLELTGLQGGAAFENLSRMGQIADGEITGPLMEAISGANAALQGLHGAGISNQEMFAGLALTATQAYEQIIAQGADGQAAFQMMQPSLQTIWELQQQFSYEVDAATQALLDQAVAAGVVGEAHRSAEERTAAAMAHVADTLDRIAIALGATLPDAAEQGAREIQGAFDAMDLRVKARVDWELPPDAIAGMTSGSVSNGGAQAEGGDYWVTRPTLFLAGEAGAERATFTPARSGGSKQPVVIEVRSVLDGRTLARNQVRYLLDEAKLAGG